MINLTLDSLCLTFSCLFNSKPYFKNKNFWNLRLTFKKLLIYRIGPRTLPCLPPPHTHTPLLNDYFFILFFWFLCLSCLLFISYHFLRFGLKPLLFSLYFLIWVISLVFRVPITTEMMISPNLSLDFREHLS